MAGSFLDDWPLGAFPSGLAAARRAAPTAGARSARLCAPRNSRCSGCGRDRGQVHAAVYQPRRPGGCVVSLAVTDGRVPSLGVFHAPAIRLERALQDLHRYRGDGPARPRGRGWTTAAGDRQPAGRTPHAGRGRGRRPGVPRRGQGRACTRSRWAPCTPASSSRDTSASRPTARPSCAWRRGSATRTRASRSSPRAATSPAAHGSPAAVSGDSTVAFSWAYSRAVELALGIEPPPRALWLRAVMAELERIANHLGDVGAICNDASFALMHTECGILREHVLRAAAAWCGHRLMMDRVVPGGVTVDMTAAGREAIAALVRRIDRRLPELIELYDNTASLQDRTVGTGLLKPDLAAQIRRRRVHRPRLRPRLRCAARPRVRAVRRRRASRRRVLADGDVDAPAARAHRGDPAPACGCSTALLAGLPRRRYRLRGPAARPARASRPPR